MHEEIETIIKSDPRCPGAILLKAVEGFNEMKYFMYASTKKYGIGAFKPRIGHDLWTAQGEVRIIQSLGALNMLSKVEHYNWLTDRPDKSTLAAAWYAEKISNLPIIRGILTTITKEIPLEDQIGLIIRQSNSLPDVREIVKILDENKVPKGYEEFVDTLKTMHELAKILRKEKFLIKILYCRVIY